MSPHANDNVDLDTATEAFGACHDAAALSCLVDVRRAAVYERADTVIPGARWHDPADPDAWIDTLPTDRPVLVYCVHGHEVSRAAVLRLRAAGLDARFLRGGIEAWRAAGRPLQAKEIAS